MDSLEDICREIVLSVIASVSDVMDGEWGDRDWERIVVNYETLSHQPDETTSAIAFSVARQKSGDWEIVDFRLSDAAEADLERLKLAMHAQKDAYWTVCDLTIERDGRYKFCYSYDTPYRLSGNIHDKRFDHYLESYRAEKSGQVGGKGV